jgi:hypothetical protein
MTYLIQIQTAAGQITVGHFDTLAAARKYLAGVRSGVIVPLIPADAATAQTLTTATREQIKSMFDNLPPAKFRAGATHQHTTGQK